MTGPMLAKRLRQLNLISDLMVEHATHDDAQTFHYWRNLEDKLDEEDLAAQSLARKDEIAQMFISFAVQFGAQDVASSWGPMTGLTADGVVFYEHKVPVRLPGQWVSRGTIEHYFGEGMHGVMWSLRDGNTTAKGKELQRQFKELNDHIEGPTELHDFMLNEFGLHKAPGSSIDNGKRVILPPRIYQTPIGLFLRTPQERMYELSENWERVPTSVFVFAQDVASMFRREAEAEKTL